MDQATDSTATPAFGFRIACLIAGPVAALLMYLFMQPDDPSMIEAPLTGGGIVVASLMIWMAIWWLTEAVDIAVTALLPVIILPLFGAVGMNQVVAPYADKLIFLFAGGLLIALSLHKWKLDQRIALLALRTIGPSPGRMIAGFMIVTAVLSSFVSNTATTAMMLPLAMGIVELAEEGTPHAGRSRFAVALLLAIAWSASIGGTCTIIGTFPNGIAVGFLEQEYGVSISFLQWSMMTVPIAIIMLPITWWILVRLLYRPEPMDNSRSGAFLQERLDRLGPMSRGEKVTIIVFCLTAACWIFRPSLQEFFPGLNDGIIGITGGLVLFIIPIDPKRNQFAMDWKTARNLPWGIFILLGGGLSLAAGVKATGLSEHMASLIDDMAGFPEVIIILLIVTGIVFLTELTSNTATTATFVPILAALSVPLGIAPVELVIPATIAASCAFMMPVATPPNAIVFGSGRLTVPLMCRGGFFMNILAMVVVTMAAFTTVRWVVSNHFDPGTGTPVAMTGSEGR